MKNIAKTDYLPNLREIEQHFDAFKDEYNDEVLRTHAREDAAANIPRPDSEQESPYEQQIMHDAASLASKVAAAFRSALEVIDAKIKAEDQKSRSEHQHKLAEIDLDHGITVDATENSFGLTDAHKQLESSEQRYNDLYAKFGRQPVFYIPHWLYVVFALLIFLGEVPLNALVFEIFGENQVMTWVMALIIGLSVPLTAHFIGIKLREHGDGFSWPNTLKALAAFAVLTIALYGLSVMRTTYLGENMEVLGLTKALVKSSFSFFWLNIAVFSTAILVSYLAHDSVPGYQDAEVKHDQNRRSVERQEKRRVKDLVKSGRERAEALKQANAYLRESLVQVTMLKGVYDQVLKEGQEHEERALQLLWKMLSVYRQENLRQRTDSATPKSFATKPEFQLKLIHMKEKLDNDSADREEQSGSSANV